METINQAASAAAKAVWGEENAHKEPVSGAKGDVAKGEPYDAGNLEPTRQEQVERSLEGRGFENTLSAQPTYENATSHQAETGINPTPGDSSELRNTETATPDLSGKSSKPSEGLSALDSQPSEGIDTRPQEHTDTTDASRQEIPDINPSSSNSSKEDDDSSSKGTGQEYVRSTGLAADGGDFDATKPGAGREAERLMEQKGLHHDEDSSHADGGKDKKGLGHRIKEKLHKH